MPIIKAYVSDHIKKAVREYCDRYHISESELVKYLLEQELTHPQGPGGDYYGDCNCGAPISFAEFLPWSRQLTLTCPKGHRTKVFQYKEEPSWKK